MLSFKKIMISILRSLIASTGPISYAAFMNECLTNPLHGYYTNSTVFGRRGDFITSPEVSQIFGELIGVWVLNEWTKLAPGGQACPLQVVEFGPGRGTLADDIMRTISQFKLNDSRPANQLISYCMVEVSRKLIETQQRRLCDQQISSFDVKNGLILENSTKYGCPVQWYSSLAAVPKRFSCFIANEFLDALPVQKFRKIDNGWREVLVDYDSKADKFVEVLASSETPPENLVRFLNSHAVNDVAFRANRLLKCIEVSTESLATVSQIDERIGTDGGMGLIVDYGHLGDKEDTVRGFKKHTVVNPLENAGSCDITADVNFQLLPQVCRHASVFGPVRQRDFLVNMGIALRLKALLERCPSPAERKTMVDAVDMLLNPKRMGDRFKVMAFLPGRVAGHVPCGFVSPYDERR